jgi:hypothetical protein
MASTAPTPFREALETRLSQLANETEKLFDEARERARRELADQLNQAVRRIRHCGSVQEVASTLADAAVALCGGAIVLHVEDGAARCERIEIPLASAAALAGALETRDPVVAAATPGEVSQGLIDLLGHAPEDRVSIFPVVAGDCVPALVYAWGRVEGAALELLTQAAGAAWHILTPPPPPIELVNIAPPAVAQPPAEPARSSAWESLPPDEQQMHLRGQRFARVQVAEMRLFHADAVQAGRARRNLYEALQKQIDAARESFRKTYFASCKSMVDYVHLELLRTLAHDDQELLGKDYPGPMV